MLYNDHHMQANPNRQQPRVLIMEDEFIVALDLSDMARDLGFEVEGPFATLADGVRAVTERRPDAAILDVQLADSEVFPLADRLIELGVPIIFHSGHAEASSLLARYPTARSAAKPCASHVLAEYLMRAAATRE